MTDTTKNYHQMTLPKEFAKSRLTASSTHHTIKEKEGVGIQGYCPNRIIDGNMNFDGDCINMCAKTLIECCKKWGAQNFTFSCYRAELTDDYNGGGNLRDKQLNIMKQNGVLIHFFVVNTKLNKMIDRSQGQFQFIDYDYYRCEKCHLYGLENLTMWDIPATDLLEGGLDITQVRKVRAFINMISACLKDKDHRAVSVVVENFAQCYKNWMNMYKRRNPRDYKKFLECSKIDQAVLDAV